ncbi:MAG: hypothetical protein RLZZ175_3148 [Bacteroidota bacterium]|jgi:superfamily II DNA or RNA helicase
MKTQDIIFQGLVNWSKVENPKIKDLYDNLVIATSNFLIIDADNQASLNTLIKALETKFPTSLSEEKKEDSKTIIQAKVVEQPTPKVEEIPIIKPEQIILNTITDKASTKKKFEKSMKTLVKGNPKDLVSDYKVIYELYNKQITQDELDAWLYVFPKHILNQYFEPKSTPDELIAKGFLMYDVSNPNNIKLAYRYLYLSGDVAKTLDSVARLVLQKNPNESIKISDSQLNYQIAELQKVLPVAKRIDAVNPDDKIYLIPHNEFCKTYLITKLREGSKLFFNGATSLYEVFLLFLRRLQEREFTGSFSKEDVLKYVENKRLLLSEIEKRSIAEEKQKELIEDRKQKAKNEGDRLFTKFLEEELHEHDIQIINAEWNRKFNGVVETDWSKIPVTFEFSQVFKGGDPLLLTTTQRNGVAYRQVKKSAMLGYDVGVGKTITSIACIANAFAMGDAKRALVVVPDATFKKWIMEISGGYDKDGFWIYGAVPNVNLLAWGNLNTEITFNEIRDYSAPEKALINDLILAKKELARLLGMREYFDEHFDELCDKLVAILYKLSDNKLLYPDLITKYKSLKIEKVKKLDAKIIWKGIVDTKVEIESEINIAIYTLGAIKPIPEGTIILVNYTGMVRIGLNDNSRSVLRDGLYTVLSQGELKPKEEAQLVKKIDECIGTSMRDARLMIDEMKVDMLVIDEAHNMKKSFTRVAGDVKTGNDAGVDKEGYVKRETARYNLDSGQPSNQGIHAFCLSQYIQKVAKGCNLMLTATPFTNSPLEVFSMLALTNYQRLIETGKDSLKSFFDTFIKEENQIVINAKNLPEVKPVVVGFRHLPELRQMIYDIIDYKTGEDAMVIRPEAISIPDLSKDKKWGGAETFLQMNALQRMYMSKIQQYLNDEKFTLVDVCQGALENENMCTYTSEYLHDMQKLDDADDEAEATRILRALSFQKLLAVSPYLFACNDLPCPTYLEYINESPKLEYLMKCIRTVKEYHEIRKEDVSGQVIYMNAGTRYFHLMKEYLVKEIGYKPNEVELVYGEITKEKKESIKERFLAGEVKVIIGSGTIKEGIDLQNKSTVLYILIPDWNPTDYNQVKGRIWRQGNQFAYVRIVNILMADTSDVFIFQKLQEKTKRLKELLDRNSKKSQLDLDDVNPEEIKENLITDPRVKAKLQIKRFNKEKELEIAVIKNELNRLTGLQESSTVFGNLHPKIVASVNDFNIKYASFLKEQDELEDAKAKQEWETKQSAKTKGKETEYKSKFNPENEAYIAEQYEVNNYNPNYIERINRRLVLVMQKLKDNVIAEVNNLGYYVLQDMISSWRAVKSDFIKGVETLESMNLSLDQLNDIVEEKKNKINDLYKEIAELPAKLDELSKTNQVQREAYLKQLKTINERVEEFANLNHYMEFKMKKADKLVVIEEVVEPIIIEETELINEEVKQIIEEKSKSKPKKKPTKEMLELRLEGLKEMLLDDPKNENLALRIEGLEILVEEAA